MENFTFYSPTEFVFGKDAELQTGRMLAFYGAKKVFIHYGGGSVVRSGLLGRITSQLENLGIAYVLLGGAKPNPIDTLVYEGIDLVKKENCDFVLAVGGDLPLILPKRLRQERSMMVIFGISTTAKLRLRKPCRWGLC
ncbi:MAG: iron-containing alcohol dehydrogenase [Candidatus Izemoplasmatales bacterium]|nr:iron-containing alcohol dehydrogenase [Candidatus Izemoplasmatales bacterium]